MPHAAPLTEKREGLWILPEVDLPRSWPDQAKRACVHPAGLAHVAIRKVRGLLTDSPRKAACLAAERDAALAELAQAREEARILRARTEGVDPRRRPHYPPPERLAILTLRAAAGWTSEETTKRFLLTPATIANWMRRVDEHGEKELVSLREPLNRYPSFVAQVVEQLKAAFPIAGSKRIADILARGGVHLARSTVRRMLERATRTDDPPPDPLGPTERKKEPALRIEGEGKSVKADYVHHVWHADLTLLPIVGGWWAPWIPFSLPQLWPFCFWFGAVLDQDSRSVMAWKLWLTQPTAKQVASMFEAARKKAGRAPKYVVSDKGAQFTAAEHLHWCTEHGVKPRFGAVGKSGSIALIERFFRSVKEELLRRLPLVPVSLAAMTAEVAAWILGHQTVRPHQGLGGRTPEEVLTAVVPARERVRVETRKAYPLARGDPKRRARRARGRLVLHVEHVEGRAHLPVPELRRAA